MNESSVPDIPLDSSSCLVDPRSSRDYASRGACSDLISMLDATANSHIDVSEQSKCDLFMEGLFDSGDSMNKNNFDDEDLYGDLDQSSKVNDLSGSELEEPQKQDNQESKPDEQASSDKSESEMIDQECFTTVTMPLECDESNKLVDPRVNNEIKEIKESNQLDKPCFGFDPLPINNPDQSSSMCSDLLNKLIKTGLLSQIGDVSGIKSILEGEKPALSHIQPDITRIEPVTQKESNLESKTQQSCIKQEYKKVPSVKRNERLELLLLNRTEAALKSVEKKYNTNGSVRRDFLNREDLCIDMMMLMNYEFCHNKHKPSNLNKRKRIQKVVTELAKEDGEVESDKENDKTKTKRGSNDKENEKRNRVERHDRSESRRSENRKHYRSPSRSEEHRHKRYRDRTRSRSRDKDRWNKKTCLNRSSTHEDRDDRSNRRDTRHHHHRKN